MCKRLNHRLWAPDPLFESLSLGSRAGSLRKASLLSPLGVCWPLPIGGASGRRERPRRDALASVRQVCSPQQGRLALAVTGGGPRRLALPALARLFPLGSVPKLCTDPQPQSPEAAAEFRSLLQAWCGVGVYSPSFSTRSFNPRATVASYNHCLWPRLPSQFARTRATDSLY